MPKAPEVNAYFLRDIFKGTFPQAAERIAWEVADDKRKEVLLTAEEVESPLVIYLTVGNYSLTPDLTFGSKTDYPLPDKYIKGRFRVWGMERFPCTFETETERFPNLADNLTNPEKRLDELIPYVYNLYEILIGKNSEFKETIPTALTWFRDRELVRELVLATRRCNTRIVTSV